MTTKTAFDLDLGPISVGFDPRRQDMSVVLPAGDKLTVRYQGRDRKLRTIRGTREEVTAVLRRHGYNVC